MIMLKRSEKVAILGGGPMGLALCDLLSKRFETVHLWVAEKRISSEFTRTRKTTLLGEPYQFPENIKIGSDYSIFEKGDWTIFVALSSRRLEETMEKLFSHLDKDSIHRLALLSKGLASKTNRKKYSVLTFVDYLNSIAEEKHFTNLVSACINGPSLVQELVNKKYCFVNIGCENLKVAHYFSEIIQNDYIYAQTTPNRFEIEITALMKNPIAVACGVAQGLPQGGSNFIGEIASLGFSDMMNFCGSLNVSDEVLHGRSGLADVFTSIMSPFSRNREYGQSFVSKLLSGKNYTSIKERILLFINPGKLIQERIAKHHEHVEGVFALPSILEIAKENSIEIPLYQLLFDILSRRVPPQELLSISAKYRNKSPEMKVPISRTKHFGAHLIKGQNFQNMLEKNIYKHVSEVHGMLQRIKKQSRTIAQNIERRLSKSKYKNNRLRHLEIELDLWKKLETASDDEEHILFENLIEYYVKEIADEYLMGMRETLIWLLSPIRYMIGGLSPGGALPYINGHVKEVQELASKYNVFYTPTHRTHLDSVEVTFGLNWLGLPLPRYAADVNLMSNPIWSWILRSMGSYAVDREKTRNILYLECLSGYSTMMLESGVPSLVYLEGTRSRTGGFSQKKMGLLSTALDAYKQSGSEIIIVPITLSYESIPEDRLFCLNARPPGVYDFIRKRRKVFMDICEPIRVSEYINSEDPLHSIGDKIEETWKKNMRILPTQIIARILSENNFQIEKDQLKRQIETYVKETPGHYLTKNSATIMKNGLQLMKQMKLIDSGKNTISGKSHELLSYYGNMSPGTSLIKIEE